MTKTVDPKKILSKTLLSRDTWLYVLAEGGWSTAHHVADHLLLDHEQASHALRVLAQRGMAKKRVPHLHRPEYAVTLDCRPPDGLTVQQIVEAMHGVKPQPHA